MNSIGFFPLAIPPMPKYIEPSSTLQKNKGQNPNTNCPTRSKKFDLAREAPVRVRFKNPAFSEPDKIHRSQPTNELDLGNDQAGRKFETKEINLNGSKFPKSSKRHQ